MSTSEGLSAHSASELEEGLIAFLRGALDDGSAQVSGLTPLTGGASRQTWRFELWQSSEGGGRSAQPLILRCDPGGLSALMGNGAECRILRAAAAAGVPVPGLFLEGDESLGVPFYVMEWVEGETIPRRILRDEAFVGARGKLSAQLAASLARIHAIELGARELELLSAPGPEQNAIALELERWEAIYREASRDPHPVFELAFRWLAEHRPAGDPRALVHGDFRLGNFILGPEGLRAVLDWELAHVGDPMEDLAWLSLRSWRFGSDHLPVAGVGRQEEFWRSYEMAGGGAVDPERIRFWELFGNLRWGIVCLVQLQRFLTDNSDGASAGVELASIGRRAAETEWEILMLMERD